MWMWLEEREELGQNIWINNGKYFPKFDSHTHKCSRVSVNLKQDKSNKKHTYVYHSQTHKNQR